MLITCTNKGCLQSTEAKLNKDTNEVICMSCGKPISNLTEQIRRTLSTLGQIIRSTENKPFQARCPKCNARKDVVLIDNVPYCAVCNTELHLSAVFLNALKQHLVEQEREKKDS